MSGQLVTVTASEKPASAVVSLEKTISASEMDEAIRNTPLQTFVRWPMQDIRERCLARLREVSRYSTGRMDLLPDTPPRNFQQLILALMESHEEAWEELLQIYLFSQGSNEWCMEAVRFSVSVANHPWFSPSAVVLKHLAGRVNVAFFSLTDSSFTKEKAVATGVQAFVMEMLAGFLPGCNTGIDGKKRYGERGWTTLRRCVKIAIETKDATYVDGLQIIIREMEAGNVKPADFDPGDIKRSENLAFLKAAHQYLVWHGRP